MKYAIDNDMHIHSFLSSCSNDPKQSPEAILEYAKKCGCKFYLGSDAHHPDALYEAIPKFQRGIDALELLEDDKFILWESVKQ